MRRAANYQGKLFATEVCALSVLFRLTFQKKLCVVTAYYMYLATTISMNTLANEISGVTAESFLNGALPCKNVIVDKVLRATDPTDCKQF